MAEISTLRKVLEDFGFETVTDLAKNLERKSARGKSGVMGNPIASGDLSESIRFTVKHMGGELVFKLFIADYYKWVDEGRPPTGADAIKGSPTLQEKIREWIKIKGINPYGKESPAERGKRLKAKRITYTDAVEGLSWAISKTIHKIGYKKTDFYSDVVNEKTLAKLKATIGEAAKKDVLLQIKQLK